MTIEQILEQACLRADEESSDYSDVAVVYINDILVQFLDCENNIRCTAGLERLEMAPIIAGIDEEFPYSEKLIVPASLMLASNIVEDDDLNKSSLWQNRAIDMLNGFRVYVYEDVPNVWGDYYD